MKPTFVLCALLAAAGCVSPTPAPSATATLVPTGRSTAAPSVEPTLSPEPTTRWAVDVVNADTPLILSITTDRAWYAWLIPAAGRMVLLDLPTTPVEGTIELMGLDCQLFDSAALLRPSFTITIQRTSPAPAAFALDLRPGASIGGKANTDYTGGCSG